MEMLNVECISSLNAPPESVLEETDFYTHSTSRNPLIEEQMGGDSSISDVSAKSLTRGNRSSRDRAGVPEASLDAGGNQV